MGANESTQTPQAPTTSTVEKEPVTTEYQLKPHQRYARWGLGRGIDITKPTPWLQKTSFQVRSVGRGDIIETDDGGLLLAYSDEIRSTTTLHSEVTAGFKPPDLPINIGVEHEYTRSTLSSKHVIGTKVKNRTISFHVDFADVPQPPLPGGERTATTPLLSDTDQRAPPSLESEIVPQSILEAVQEIKEAKKAIIEAREEIKNGIQSAIKSVPVSAVAADSSGPSKDEKELSEEDIFNGEPFEKRLCEWLTNCLKHRGKPSIAGKSLQDRIREEGDSLEIKEDIQRVVEHFGITHYVSAIELGGLEYSVLTEKEYDKKAKVGANISLDALAYGGLQTSASVMEANKRTRSMSERKQIGKITDHKFVAREDEAVIGCKIVPISKLVKNAYLQDALRESIKKYSQNQTKDKGPFLITCICGHGFIKFLTVEPKTKHLATTSKKEEAETFTVKVLSDSPSHHQFEFSLTSTCGTGRTDHTEEMQSQAHAEETELQANYEETQSQANAGEYEETQLHATNVGEDEETQSQANTGEYEETQMQANVASFSSVNEISTAPLIDTAIKQDDIRTRRDPLPLEYYLETEVNPLTGNSTDPPRMRMNSNYQNTRMLLKKRIDHRLSCNTKQWRKGREAYYISCVHRFHNGYLCVIEETRAENHNAPGCTASSCTVCVKSSVDFHCDDSKHVFMLFRLQ